MNRPLSDHELELISAELDGQLDTQQQAELAQLYQTRPELLKEAESLKKTRQVLRSVGMRPVRRNFTLKASMLQTEKSSGWLRMLQFTSAFASLAAVVVLALDLGAGLFGQSAMTAAAPAANQALTAKSAESATQPVEIIQWFTGGSGGGGGGGGYGGGPATAPQAGVAQVELTPPGSVNTSKLSPTPTPYFPPVTVMNITPTSYESILPQPPTPENALTPIPPEAPGANLQSTEPTSSNDYAAPQPRNGVVDAGPILGVPASGDQGKVSTAPANYLAYPASIQIPWNRIAEIGLALIAIATGAAAFFLRKRH